MEKVDNLPIPKLSTFAISEIPEKIIEEANQKANEAYIMTIVKYGYLSQEQAEKILKSSVV